MGRPDDHIELPLDTSWLRDPDARAVCDAVTRGGHVIYFVGGCVRNALLGAASGDVDLATDALPQTVMQLAEAAGLKAVPTGIDHGTITVVSGGKPFEVTTFRRDVATDGRRAVVSFTDDIREDARRRDFTLNALYATPEGRVVDPLGGLPDLLARRIRFIEDPTARIREDYLRILRFFRFWAWYGDPEAGFDPEALAAIAAESDGIETLSAERLGAEMRKLLAAPDPSPALAVMDRCGVLHRVLPGADPRWVGPVAHIEAALNLDPDWRTRLAALGGGEDVAKRLRLSKVDARRLNLLRTEGFAGAGLAEVAYRHGEDVARAVLVLRHAMAGTLPETAELETIAKAATQEFPLSGADLMPTYRGKALGARLKYLEDRWIASRFSLGRTELLDLP